MFEHRYRVTQLLRRKLDNTGIIDNKGIVEEFLYKFKTEHSVRYHILVHRYEKDIFVIKFYAQRHEKHPYKYNFLLGNNIASKILGTCYHIILDFFIPKFQEASFGFIGERSIYKDGTFEGRENTKRFRTYIYLISNMHGLETYDHFSNEEYSSYLMILKNNKREEKLEYALQLFGQVIPNIELSTNMSS